MGRGSGTFERLLDKATSQLLLETDWESILQICDLIRQGDTQAKYAVNSIKKKVNDKNPHVALYALEVTRTLLQFFLSSDSRILPLLVSDVHIAISGDL